LDHDVTIMQTDGWTVERKVTALGPLMGARRVALLVVWVQWQWHWTLFLVCGRNGTERRS